MGAISHWLGPPCGIACTSSEFRVTVVDFCRGKKNTYRPPSFLELRGFAYQWVDSSTKRQWSIIDISSFEATGKDQLLKCSLQTPRLSILIHRFKWQINWYTANHARPLAIFKYLSKTSIIDNSLDFSIAIYPSKAFDNDSKIVGF